MALVGVIVILDGPGVIVNVADTVKVQPRLLVSVIMGEPAPNPVIVCPVTVPEVLVIVDIETVFVGVIVIIPLFNPHVGLVNDKIAAGFGFMTTLIVFEDWHPSALVPDTL